MIRELLDAFWDEGLWLPPNTTWSDIAPGPNKKVTYTDHQHILMTIPMTLVFFTLRFGVDKFVFTPLGMKLGIKDKRNKKAPPNRKLEAAYRANSDSKKICVIAKQSDMSERQVSRWWRMRRAQDRPPALTKFRESAWRCTFMLYNSLFGVVVLWNREWLWDIDHCFNGYPHQGVTDGVWWYYMVSFMYYWSETLSLLWDVRRKDFKQLLVHHVAALVMMSVSWVCNYHRLGSLVYLSHDSSDTLLEATKIARYAGYRRLCDWMFAIFTVLWIITRLGIYPFYIIRGAVVTAPKYLSLPPALHMLNSFFFVLLALNLYWTWLILQIAYNSIRAGQVERDIRSASSESSSSLSNASE